MEYGKSIFPVMPEDEKAICFDETYDANPDGKGDNTKALQRAIDELEQRSTIGIIFIPEGIYRFRGTVNLWRGIRLIGFGKNRPKFVLDDNVPEFQGSSSSYLIFCRNVKPAAGEFLRDANECSFFTSVKNIDFDLGYGNKGAVAVRYHIAQLCTIEDCDFYLHDAKAAVEFVGNEIERCRFFGGQYGIIGYYTAPGWQFYVGDCVFKNQKRAGIMSSKTGLTLVRDTFQNMPWGIYVPNKELYDVPINETERLYMEDCRAEQMGIAVISMGWLRNTNNWLHVTGTICRSAPMFLECFGYQFVYFFTEPPIETEYSCYQIETHIGFGVKANNWEIERKFSYEYYVSEADWSEVPEPEHLLMPDLEKWCSIREYGAAGDGSSDDTDAFLRAVREKDVLYIPQGIYRITKPLLLKKNTCLIALHPGTTILTIPDDTPVFSDLGKPASVLTIPKKGRNYICGLGIEGGRNPGSTDVEWMGVPESVMEDCQFHADIQGFSKKQGVNAIKPEEEIKKGIRVIKKGKDKNHTLWIHDGGAGVFKNIWSNNGMAREGLYISDTDRPGKIYLVSVEHHYGMEVRLKNVSNWKIVSLQTEEAYGDEHTTAMICEDCEDIIFANLFQYRMQSFEVNHPFANHLKDCRRIQFWGVHDFSNGPNGWENSVMLDGRLCIADREIGILKINC